MTLPDAQLHFNGIVEALVVSPDIALSTGKGFGGGGLMAGGKLFATLRGDELLLKLPAAKVAGLVASGDGAPFDAGKGRPMKEWVLLRPEAATEWAALARQAATFVGARA